MRLNIELARDDDGSWLAAILELPGVAVRGADRIEAFRRAEAMALRILASSLENDVPIPGAPAELAVAFSLV